MTEPILTQIISEMNTFLEKLKNAIVKYENAFENLNKEKKRIEEQSTSHQKKHTELSARESAVVHVEKADQMMKDAQVKMDQAIAAQAKLDSDRKQFNLERDEKLDKIKQSTERQLREAQINEKNRLELDERAKKLDEEVKERVDTILSKMAPAPVSKTVPLTQPPSLPPKPLSSSKPILKKKG